jgi:hypothetical protein
MMNSCGAVDRDRFEACKLLNCFIATLSVIFSSIQAAMIDERAKVSPVAKVSDDSNA